MKKAVYRVKELANKECKLGFYEGKILGIPAWRVLRFKTRTNYFKKNTEFNNKSNKKEDVSIAILVKSYFNSFLALIKLLLSSKRCSNVIYAFPRLARLDDTYLDKFTDPMIEYTDVKNDFLIFQRSLGGSHSKPRKHDNNTIETDFIDITVKILGVVFFPIFLLCYVKTILGIYKKAKELFGVGFLFVIKSSIDLGEFYTKHFFVKILLRKLQAKNVFVVNRGAFIPVIVSARKVNARVYEMQHGVTLSDTILYAGEYHPLADPDYFLAFGKKWIASQFYIPLEKIVNVGWGYKRMVNNSLQKPVFSDKCILVISSPNCTFKLFDVVLKLAEVFSEYEFHLRLHPQEGYKEAQYKAIAEIDNIKMDDRSVDSAVVVNRYKYLIGENSSVLYEALCLNKRVARIEMGGLEIKDQNNRATTGFFYVKSIEDFKEFLNLEGELNSLPEQGVYDDFDETVVNKLIKNCKL
ncbi:hypothetical protein [Aequorivita viscosa]|uniref:CDP-Glycerol:Poly(Glycerophosphate) glycerophosphotransferase n=1 Tax=Aequorivita viscosa TaxID=797419 RepID=A0A1M6FN13_9FLAO|nr:hypothetical protein [Aequorivita viscosa]SDW75154.1 hypothetical protein SAMN05216556_109110 [Aequorivita viscosa]SHI99072.1 hypothetical protein SAMN04487908_1086 [Aequorivita viscosa]